MQQKLIVSILGLLLGTSTCWASISEKIDLTIEGDTSISGEIVMTDAGRLLIDFSLSTKQARKEVGVWIALLDDRGRVVYEPWFSPHRFNVSKSGGSQKQHLEQSVPKDKIGRVSSILFDAYRADSYHPSCPYQNLPKQIVQTSGAAHVIIIPGLLGSNGNVDEAKKMIEEYRQADGDITVQIWDWWQFEDRKALADEVIKRRWPDGNVTLGLQAYLAITDVTRVMADRLATEIQNWKRPERTKKLYLVSLSAGTNIASLLGAVKDSSREYKVPDRYFDKCIFISGVLSKESPLTDTARISKSIYNYYSHRDELLTTSKYYYEFFLFRIRIDANISWPASGRFPFVEGNPGYKDLTLQLGFLSESDMGISTKTYNLDNQGTHLDRGALSPEYFKAMILPLFQENNTLLPKWNPNVPKRDGWLKPPHPFYPQDSWEKELSKKSATPS